MRDIVSSISDQGPVVVDLGDKGGKVVVPAKDDVVRMRPAPKIAARDG